MGPGRVMRTVGFGLLLAAGAAAAALLYALRRPLPRLKGRLRLTGLRSTVEIIRDRWGIPHIYADNFQDLMFGVGYVQAQDRLWQMEFNRRLASGTLSEVLGETTVEIDRLLRRIGFRRAAEREWRSWDQQGRAALEAFSAGVNAYQKTHARRLPLEFTILRYRPQPWQPVDTLAFGRFMGWSLAGNWDAEILRSWIIERFGSELMAELEPGYPVGKPIIVPVGAEAGGAGPPLKDEYRKVQELTGVIGPAMSNNWAVDGEKSATGKPLLANDPHLPLQMPSIWYEMHLHSPEVQVAGAGLPGTPGVVIGHNGRIAWGVTAALADGDDLFVERINPDNPHQYEYQGQWLDAEVVREEIRVRGRAQPLVEEVVVTRHGPIISPAIKGEKRALALRTVGLEESRQVEAQMMLARARNWEEFREALRQWPTPPLNFAYADVEGNIGYQMAGLVPIRAKGYGLVPAPGWTGEYEWTGFVPLEELPSAYNPPTHWVASANNKIVDDDYPHFLSAEYADSGRIERIVQLLKAKDKLSVDDFKAMHGDLYSVAGRELAQHLLGLAPKDEWSRRALNFLKVWDYVLSPDSVAASIVQLSFVHLVRRALEEKLGSPWTEFFMGRGLHPLKTGRFFYDAASWLLKKIQERPDWFQGRSWQEVMEESLAAAVAELRRLLGDDMSRWQWGRLHTQTFQHPLGQVRALARVFNRGPVPMGGDANTVLQAAYAPYLGYNVNSFTVSYRQIIDLADVGRSLAVIPSGQSGHPGSRHYADMIEPWRRIEYHPLLWEREQVERQAEGRLLLEPASGNREPGT